MRLYEEKKESGMNFYWNMSFDFGKSGKLYTGRTSVESSL